MGIKPLIAIMTILLASIAASQIVGFQDTISIGETPYEYIFHVINNSNEQKPLLIEYHFPVKYEKISQPVFIEPQTQEQIKIKIYPSKKLEGSTYVGTIKVQIGSEFAEKNLIMEFKKENKCTIKPEAEFDSSGSVKLKLVNPSYNQKSIELKSIKGPNDWEIIGDKNFIINPNEIKETSTKIKMKTTYSGSVVFVFSCHNEEILAEAKIEHFEKDVLQQITGLFTASQFKIDATSLAINLLLGIVAAILLLAFIARLTKFYMVKK
jgi:hypothetical protein